MSKQDLGSFLEAHSTMDGLPIGDIRDQHVSDDTTRKPPMADGSLREVAHEFYKVASQSNVAESAEEEPIEEVSTIVEARAPVVSTNNPVKTILKSAPLDGHSEVTLLDAAHEKPKQKPRSK